MPSSAEMNVRLVSVLTGFDSFTPIEQVTAEFVPRRFALKGLAFSSPHRRLSRLSVLRAAI